MDRQPQRGHDVRTSIRIGKDPRFKQQLSGKNSSFHVAPVIENKVHTGYRLITEFHADWWERDLTSTPSEVIVSQGVLKPKPNRKLFDVLDRDCCLILDTVFCAKGGGIQFDDNAVELLKQAQHDRRGISKTAVFGKTSNGRVDGRRGRHLEITGSLAKKFIKWIERKSKEIDVQLRTKSNISVNDQLFRPSRRRGVGIC